MRSLVWFRGKDLRVADHAPLLEGAAGELIPVFVVDPYFFASDRAAELPHRMQFLLEALAELAETLEKLGSKLLCVRGRCTEVIPRLAAEFDVDQVVAQRWTEPFARERDRQVAERLRVPFRLFEGETLLPPGTLRTGSGTPYSVFTPFKNTFHRTFQAVGPLPAPTSLPPLPADVDFVSEPLPTLTELKLVRNDRLQTGGERHAQGRLQRFMDEALVNYGHDRDRMDRPGTSRISADLKFGTLSPRSVWHAVSACLPGEGQRSFLNEIVWREFAHSTLWDRPELLKQSFRPRFADFPWREDEGAYTAWAEGKTGIPIVDAAARQLLAEGFVHNRARMISACFLTKQLMISYQRGEAHYMKWLTDGDWAQNNAGWQWCAGTGCDAQPYFRVFNPVRQGQRFDPDGTYVRRWVPELAQVPKRYIHSPWTAPALELSASGVILGDTYPPPIVDLSEARARYLGVAGARKSKVPA